MIFSAFAGRRLWLKVKKKYDVENGKYVLLMPENDRELNETALKHIDDLLKYRKGKSVLILTTDSWVLENAKKYSSNIVDVAKITDKQADRYCRYYYYSYFSERFLVVSLGNSLFKAVGVNGITKEDLLCLGIFLMRNYSNAEEKNG